MVRGLGMCFQMFPGWWGLLLGPNKQRVIAQVDRLGCVAEPFERNRRHDGG